MWRPSTSNGSWSGRRRRPGRAAPKSSRCSALEMTPCVARQAEVALQPLGQPGAAGPDADQRGVRLQQRAHAAEQLARRALRRRGCAGRPARGVMRRLAQELLEDDRGRGRVGVGRAGARAPRSCCSARRPRAPAGRSGRAAGARSAARARVLSCARAVGMEGHADHQRVGLPLGDQRGDRVEARVALGGDRASAASRVRVSELPVATPMRRVPKSKARKD